MLQSPAFRIFAILALSLLYCVLFYLQYQHAIKIDFSSFYFAADSLSNGINPYRVITTNYILGLKKLPINLNPPSLLWVFQAFLPLGYNKALILWTILITSAGIKAAAIAYDILREKFGKSWNIGRFDYWLLYFSMYPLVVNSVLSQVGVIISFFILLGYKCSTQKMPYRAGILWGIIAALKLFPLLLFVYALLNKQKRIAGIMLLTFVLISLLPLYNYGIELFINYYKTLHLVLWYGDNWNASIYGILFRITIDPWQVNQTLLICIKYFYGIIFTLGIIFYCFKSKQFINNKNELGAFNLTLAMMLLLSPIGWLYYSSLLILPAYTQWNILQQAYNKLNLSNFLTTYFALILFFVPISYLSSSFMPGGVTSFTVYSSYFYALLLLNISLCFPANAAELSYSVQDVFMFNRILLIIIIWGLLVLGFYTGRALINYTDIWHITSTYRTL
ncbi:MAG: glycosyltransferase family 87 protein [Legionella sp.]